MDFETLFTLFLVLAYLIIQVLSRKKKPPQRPPQQVPPDYTPEASYEFEVAEAPEEVTMEDALQQIREALGMPPPQEAPRVPEPVPTPPPPPVAPEIEVQPHWDPPQEVLPHPTGFALEESFADGSHVGGPHRLVATSEAERALQALPYAEQGPPLRLQPTALRKKLKNQRAAREAFVLGEVFGPPRSRGRTRRI